MGIKIKLFALLSISLIALAGCEEVQVATVKGTSAEEVYRISKLYAFSKAYQVIHDDKENLALRILVYEDIQTYGFGTSPAASAIIGQSSTTSKRSETITLIMVQQGADVKINVHARGPFTGLRNNMIRYFEYIEQVGYEVDSPLLSEQ